jgi:hypothetical protein
MRGAAVLVIVIAVVLIGLVLLARRRSEQTWTPERYEKERKGGTALGNAMLSTQALLEGKQTAFEERLEEDAEQTSSGDPPVPGARDDEP